MLNEVQIRPSRTMVFYNSLEEANRADARKDAIAVMHQEVEERKRCCAAAVAAMADKGNDYGILKSDIESTGGWNPPAVRAAGSTNPAVLRSVLSRGFMKFLDIYGPKY